MRKIVLGIVLSLLVCSTGFTFWPFPDVTVKTDIKKLQDSTDKNFSDIQAGVNSNKTGINDVKDTQVQTTTELGVLKNNVLSMNNRLDLVLNTVLKLSATAQGQAGANNSAITAGGSVKQKTSTSIYNDPSVLLKVVTSLFAFMTFFVGKFFADSKAKDQIIRDKDKQLANINDQLMKRLDQKDEDYEALVKLNNDNLQAVIKSKEEYKTKYFELVSSVVQK